MDDDPIVPVDDMVPSVPLDESSENLHDGNGDRTGPPGLPGYAMDASRGRLGHPSGMNRAQRRAADERHKKASRDRRMREQARQRRQKRRSR